MREGCSKIFTDDFSKICGELQEKEYKLTPQRQEILRVFLQNPGSHLSAEEVYTLVKKVSKDIGLATVYRTLDLLAELDILQKLDFGDGRSRYELNDQKVHHHHHLVCLKCGKVLEFDVDLLEPLEKQIFDQTKFEILDHELKFYGYCSECSGN